MKRVRSWNPAVGGFGLLVAAWWAAYLVRAVPWMVRSEVAHYVWALVVLVGISVLRPAFAGNARQWWLLALGLQLWSYCEHFLLVVQLGTGWRLAHAPVPTSILQLLVPRVEMHELYNTIVTIPMVVAVILRALEHRAHTSAAHSS